MTEMAYSTEGFTRSRFTIDGIESTVYAMGEGDPLVYFHGGGTYHGFEWLRGFADRFRVIAPHHPNFGESGDADFASMGDYVIHYEMLFAAMGLERFHLCGASMGGHMAARYAVEHPEEIDRLVLAAPAGLKSEHARIPDWSQVPPDQIRGMFVASLDWLEAYWPAEPGAEWLALRAREAAAAAANRENPEVSDAILRKGFRDFDRPTLLLWGEHDKVVPTGFIPDWERAVPHADVAVIPGGSHLLLDEFPQACAAMKAWLLG